MNRVAARFTNEMDEILAYLDLLSATLDLAKHDLRGLRSRHPVALEAKKVHAKTRSLAIRTVAYDGPYLAACAQFELAIRDTIEEFIGDVSAKLTDYNHLPSSIKEWHPVGCAHVLLDMGQDRFGHLTKANIVSSISSCVTSSTAKPYRLTVEAFSAHERNLKPDVIDGMLSERLGLDKVWQKLAREPIVGGYFGSSNPATVENLARDRLKQAMERRNAIIHRGRNYFTPGESEIRECATFFKILVTALSTVLDNYLRSL